MHFEQYFAQSQEKEKSLIDPDILNLLRPGNKGYLFGVLFIGV
jgi:hypothetical protein